MKKIIFLISILFFLNFIIAETYNDCNIYGNCKPVSTISSISYINNANDSLYWDGHSFVIGAVSTIETDPIWTLNSSAVLGCINNASYLSTYNATYDSYATNVSINYTKQTYDTYDTRWTDTYNATYAANQANNSWNQSGANLLYAGIQWGYNMTTATYNLYNAVWSSTYNATYASKVSFPGWTNVAWVNQTNIFTQNQNMSRNNITDTDCIIFKTGGKICSG